MASLIQPSFSRGELGPELYGRVDVAAYQVALRTCINAIVHSYGGASNRAGMMWIGPCKTHSGTPPNLIEFKFNTQDTYILEFGNQYMRVVRNDAHVLNAAQSITAVTQANPAVVTANAHGFSNGDDVYITGVVGMTELNNRWFTVANVTTNTFELTLQQTKANVDSTGYTAYTSGGSVSSVYEIITPYAIDDVLLLKTVQSANAMTLNHPTYPPYLLTRTDHDAWTLTEEKFAPAQDHPTNLGGSDGGTGTDRRYQVTAVNAETLEESLPATQNDNKTITAVTQANPAVVTANAHGFSNGDEVEINNIVGMVELNERRFTIGGVTTNTFELVNEDSTSHTAYSSGGRADRTAITIDGGANPDGTITFDSVANAGKYSVYREENGLFGFLGDTEDTSFADDNLAVDFNLTPPKARNPFFGVNNYPAVASYYEQRRVFGSTNDAPDTSYYSVTASQNNMSVSSPRRADDAITATLNSLEVNEIRAFVPLNDLLIFTSGSEWRVNSGTEAAFSAENLRQKPQSSWGSSHLQPIVVGDKVLFVTENNRYVRSIGYEIEVDGYRGNDMTVFSPHIFKFYDCIAWAYCQYPDPTIHTVREDGWAPALTFNPEQQVVGWSRWKTSGKFLRVASTRPNATSADTHPYFIVERKIGGQMAYYIERVKSRRFRDLRDAFFVDSGLTADSPISITGVSQADPAVVTANAHGMSDGDLVDISDVLWEPTVDPVTFTETQPRQINNRRFYVADSTANTFALVKVDGRIDISAATQANPVVITVEGHEFEDGDKIGIFNVQGMTELNGKTYEIANVTATTFELAGVDGTGYTAYDDGGKIFPAEDGTAFNAYDENGFARQAFTTFGNLWHLEGREVVILADGNVISGTIVQNGQVTLPRAASRVHIGLRYVCDLETLDPEIPGSPTLQPRSKRAPTVTIRMHDSRGLLVGPSVELLEPVQQRDTEAYGDPTELLTGDKEIPIESDWETNGRIYMRQVDPLPITISAVMPDLDVGDDEE